MRVVDHQHIAITFIIIPSPIACIHNGRSNCTVRFLFDQTCFFQISADGISFQVNSGSNMMGGKMGGPTELNPMIIGGLSQPDELSTDERSCLPESNMPSILDIVGWLFKSQILDSPKDREMTDWRSGVTSVSQTCSRNVLGCLQGNGIRNEPSGFLKAVQYLLFRPDKHQVNRVSLCPCLGVGDSWKGREIQGVGVKADEHKERDKKQPQTT